MAQSNDNYYVQGTSITLVCVARMLTFFPLENNVRVTKMQEHFNRSTQPSLRVGEKTFFA